MGGVLFIPQSLLQNKEKITMGQASIPIIREELPSKEECMAKLEAVFNDVDLTRLLNLCVTSRDNSRYGFEQIISDLYPAYRYLTKFEQSYLGAYLHENYTLDIDYLEYEAIIPEEKEIFRRVFNGSKTSICVDGLKGVVK